MNKIYNFFKIRKTNSILIIMASFLIIFFIILGFGLQKYFDLKDQKNKINKPAILVEKKSNPVSKNQTENNISPSQVNNPVNLLQPKIASKINQNKKVVNKTTFIKACATATATATASASAPSNGISSTTVSSSSSCNY